MLKSLIAPSLALISLFHINNAIATTPQAMENLSHAIHSIQCKIVDPNLDDYYYVHVIERNAIEQAQLGPIEVENIKEWFTGWLEGKADELGMSTEETKHLFFYSNCWK